MDEDEAAFFDLLLLLFRGVIMAAPFVRRLDGSTVKDAFVISVGGFMLLVGLSYCCVRCWSEMNGENKKTLQQKVLALTARASQLLAYHFLARNNSANGIPPFNHISRVPLQKIFSINVRDDDVVENVHHHHHAQDPTSQPPLVHLNFIGTLHHDYSE
jgi:hypothetical protein